MGLTKCRITPVHHHAVARRQSHRHPDVGVGRHSVSVPSHRHCDTLRRQCCRLLEILLPMLKLHLATRGQLSELAGRLQQQLHATGATYVLVSDLRPPVARHSVEANVRVLEWPLFWRDHDHVLARRRLHDVHWLVGHRHRRETSVW